MSRPAFVLIAGLLMATPVLAETSGPDGGRVTAPVPDAVDPERFSERPADVAYGAFQRGLYKTALNLATPLALEGNPAAQTLVAEIYSRGLGVRQDVVTAMEWYGKAADQKVPEAVFQLAMILLDGGPEIGDPDRAYTLLEDAADAGNRLAQFNFAQMTTSRDQSPEGMKKAVTYYEKAAEAGLADAQYAMAQIYEQGFGGKPVDMDEARRWLELAAAQNFDTAQIQLGTWLVEGVGGERDQEAGFSWLLRAARAGNPAAQNRIAKLYRAGIGVEPDRVTAAAWYLRARRAGLVDAIMEDQLHGLTDDEMQLASRRAAVL
ncbi:MAG: sel1 repeat family protein [Aquamicrobium sp.]|nr:sel1 repeat family protein [Aquamicrobium sp.]